MTVTVTCAYYEILGNARKETSRHTFAAFLGAMFLFGLAERKLSAGTVLYTLTLLALFATKFIFKLMLHVSRIIRLSAEEKGARNDC